MDNRAKKVRIAKSLLILFTEKQIKILNKLIRAETLEKQENETYSRTLKPKINAIIDLGEVALSIRDKI